MQKLTPPVAPQAIPHTPKKSQTLYAFLKDLKKPKKPRHKSGEVIN